MAYRVLVSGPAEASLDYYVDEGRKTVYVVAFLHGLQDWTERLLDSLSCRHSPPRRPAADPRHIGLGLREEVALLHPVGKLVEAVHRAEAHGRTSSGSR